MIRLSRPEVGGETEVSKARHTKIVLAFSLVLACRRSEPIEPPVVVVETEVDAIELPPLENDCEGTTPGHLSAKRGQLVFYPAEAWGESEGEAVRVPSGEGYMPLWAPRAVMLRRGTDEWFSTLLP